MDDLAVFTNFLNMCCGTLNAHSHNELQTFIPTFQMLLAVSDDNILAFIKQIHAANSAWGNNQCILIWLAMVLVLQVILFELKDREMCNALPAAAILNNITPA